MTNTTSISVRVPAELRWDCGSCGDCCRNFVLGPVSPEIIAALKDKAIHSLWPPAQDGNWYESKQGPDGQLHHFLSPNENGACVFLREDKLCSIHATLGPEFKPAFCREYPYHGILDRNRLTLIARADCTNFHESFDTGTLVEERAAEFAALPRPYGIRRFQAPQVPLIPGLAVPIMVWTGLEADILEALDTTPRSPETSIALLRATLREEIGGAWPDPNAERAGSIRNQLTHMLVNALSQGLAQPAPSDPNTKKMKRILTEALHTLQSVSGKMNEPPAPLTERSMSYFDIILRSNIMSKGLLASGPLSAGLGLHLYGTHLVRTVTNQKNMPLTPSELGPYFAPWLRFTHNGVVQRLLQQAQGSLTELFLTTPPAKSDS